MNYMSEETWRDYFASMAICGIAQLAQGGVTEPTIDQIKSDAAIAYSYADALLATRKKPSDFATIAKAGENLSNMRETLKNLEDDLVRKIDEVSRLQNSVRDLQKGISA